MFVVKIISDIKRVGEHSPCSGGIPRDSAASRKTVFIQKFARLQERVGFLVFVVDSADGGGFLFVDREDFSYLVVGVAEGDAPAVPLPVICS